MLISTSTISRLGVPRIACAVMCFRAAIAEVSKPLMPSTLIVLSYVGAS